MLVIVLMEVMKLAMTMMAVMVMSMTMMTTTTTMLMTTITGTFFSSRELREVVWVSVEVASPVTRITVVTWGDCDEDGDDEEDDREDHDDDDDDDEDHRGEGVGEERGR